MLSKLIIRIRCIVGKHSYTKIKAQWGNLQVSKCDFCNRHLNKHHGFNHSFESSEKGSILHDIETAIRLYPDK